MSSKLFKNVKDLKPVIRSTSDSGALDNVFELLTHSGKLAPLIKLMMMDVVRLVKKYSNINTKKKQVALLIFHIDI